VGMKNVLFATQLKTTKKIETRQLMTIEVVSKGREHFDTLPFLFPFASVS
jgi:hypothetical protein